MMNEREYLLVCVMEECSEIQKAASKALRFNLNDPDKIENEFIDLVALFEMLQFVTLDEERIAAKKKKVRKFMKVSIETGRLELHPSSKVLSDG
jgi:hypothetical protein